MIKIGITQRVENVAAYSERRDALDQRWALFFERLDMLIIPLPNRIEDFSKYVTEIGLDGVVLSGGNDLASQENGVNIALERDALEKQIITICIDKNIPLLGICRGMQIINEYFGGQLSKVSGHVAVTHEVSFTDSDLINRKFEVNSFHNYGILPQQLGKGLKSIALANDATVEGLRHATQNILGLMWHPERHDPFSVNDQEIITHFFKKN